LRSCFEEFLALFYKDLVYRIEELLTSPVQLSRNRPVQNDVKSSNPPTDRVELCMAYSPYRNCRIYLFFGSGGSDIRLLAIHAYWHSALRASHTRFKRYTPNVFSTVLLCFSQAEVRARSARKIFALNHIRFKKHTRILRSELDTKSYTLETLHGKYDLASIQEILKRPRPDVDTFSACAGVSARILHFRATASRP